MGVVVQEYENNEIEGFIVLKCLKLRCFVNHCHVLLTIAGLICVTIIMKQ